MCLSVSLLDILFVYYTSDILSDTFLYHCRKLQITADCRLFGFAHYQLFFQVLLAVQRAKNNHESEVCIALFQIQSKPILNVKFAFFTFFYLLYPLKGAR